MRAVLDTNVVVSGLLWRTSPRQVLDAARERRLTLYTSSVLLDELAQVYRERTSPQRSQTTIPLQSF